MLVLALSSLVAACSTGPKQMYEGPRLPPESEVTVEGRAGPISIGGGVVQAMVQITAVNGKSAFIDPFTFTHNYPSSVVVPPGSHEFSVRWITQGLTFTTVEGRVGIDAESGKRYVIAGRLAKPYGIPLSFPSPRKVEIEFYVEAPGR